MKRTVRKKGIFPGEGLCELLLQAQTDNRNFAFKRREVTDRDRNRENTLAGMKNMIYSC